ncbi:hypothetical protein COBT_001187, partial [Conglomerata obtusa]
MQYNSFLDSIFVLATNTESELNTIPLNDIDFEQRWFSAMEKDTKKRVFDLKNIGNEQIEIPFVSEIRDALKNRFKFEEIVQNNTYKFSLTLPFKQSVIENYVDKSFRTIAKTKAIENKKFNNNIKNHNIYKILFINKLKTALETFHNYIVRTHQKHNVGNIFDNICTKNFDATCVMSSLNLFADFTQTEIYAMNWLIRFFSNYSFNFFLIFPEQYSIERSINENISISIPFNFNSKKINMESFNDAIKLFYNQIIELDV